jgi:phosphoserine phosphatase
MSAQSPRFASVVLDVDSTLCGIEGIDYLAARRGPDVGGHIARLTEGAMRGDIGLGSIYGARLALVLPTSEDVSALSSAYEASVAPGAGEAIARMRSAGVSVTLMSGGIRQAILPVARSLGFADSDLWAVAVTFDTRGHYSAYDAESPLTSTRRGKQEIVRRLLSSGELRHPLLVVGDGATDAATRSVADAFAAYTGFTRHEVAVRAADFIVASFEELLQLVLPGSTE